MMTEVGPNAARSDGKLAGAQDARIMQRAVIICGVAILVLVAIKAGFLESVLP